MIHALASLDTLPETPLKVSGMWSKFAYKIGPCLFTLDDIEHGVLRCNKGHPSQNGSPAFSTPEDPRQSCVVKVFDERIHFALNCGGRYKFCYNPSAPNNQKSFPYMYFKLFLVLP